jgi:ABC-type multidrug transport system ATPase subunit
MNVMNTAAVGIGEIRSSGDQASVRQRTRVTAVDLTTRHRGKGPLALDHVSLAIEPGNLTVIVGPSGAGKTTLLSALAGLTSVDEGSVAFEDANGIRYVADVGFVPQDDILHGELPLQTTLRYAAALRLTAASSVIDATVTEVMEILGLTEHASTPVHSLSGGQRKRANIACEILTRPDVLFLDEPTSGLDPAVAADVVEHLQRMSDAGSTVVFTTHSASDIERSDQVLVMAPGGRLVASGEPDEVRARFRAATFAEMFAQLVHVQPVHEVRQSAAHRTSSPPSRRRANRPGAIQQWWALTRRSADILVRNRLTVAILLGSPASVIAMFALLFRSDAFHPASAGSASAVQVAYWLSFAGFFFGLTFGLLQVCTEVPTLRRERYAGLRIGAYLASKLALLTPILVIVNIAMIAVLRGLGRLPHLSPRALVVLAVTMLLNSMAALCLGLLASAAVTSTAQAALALPMLCFPAVLFSGAMLPVGTMATPGKLIAAVMSDRWAFEAIGRHLGVSGLIQPASPYVSLGASSTATYWGLLVIFTLVWGLGAYVAIHYRAGRSR